MSMMMVERVCDIVAFCARDDQIKNNASPLAACLFRFVDI